MDSILFITTVIVGVVQAIKSFAPRVNGGVTIIVAMLVGALAAWLKLVDISVAQGVLVGLGSVGVHVLATKVGGSSPTPQ